MMVNYGAFSRWEARSAGRRSGELIVLARPRELALIAGMAVNEV